MELKSEFLSIPLEARILFYANLPLPALMLLRLASPQTNSEIKSYLKMLFGDTTKIVFDYINETLKDPVVYTFFSNGTSFYVGKRDEELAIPDVFSKQWVHCNLAFQTFINNHYSQFNTCSFCITDLTMDQNNETINISIKDDKLKCTTVDKLNIRIQIEIEADCFKALSNPLTMEQIKPFQAQIRHEMGVKSIRAFLNNLDMEYIILFNNPRFRYYYLKKQITYKTFCHGLLNLRYKNLYKILSEMAPIRNCSIELGDYKEFEIARDWKSYGTEDSFLIWLRKHPKKPGEYYTKEELTVLNKLDYFNIIKLDSTILDSYVKHGKSVLDIMTQVNYMPRIYGIIESSRYYDVEDFMTFFKILHDPQRDIKIEAVSALLEYVTTRRQEHYRKEDTTGYTLVNFFQTPLGTDYKSKIEAAIVLIEVLYGVPNKFLSERHINVLNKGMNTDKEDRLTQLVRTRVLEPLNLPCLEVLSDSTIRHGI